jgi:hypothetical protein
VTTYAERQAEPVSTEAVSTEPVIIDATIIEPVIIEPVIIEPGSTVPSITVPDPDPALIDTVDSAAIAAVDEALGSTIPVSSTLEGIWPIGIAPDGLVQLARAQWPGTSGDELPQVAGFITSAFSPLVAATADLCLLDYFGVAPADQARGERTAIVLVTATGDLATSAAIAAAVQAGTRVPPLLFYQSNHNAVAGYVAARWGLFGPIVCTMPGSAAGPEGAAEPGRTARSDSAAGALSESLAEGIASAALLIEDGDADAALVIAANAYLDGSVSAAGMLIGPASWPLAAAPPAAVSAPDLPPPALESPRPTSAH